MFNQNRRVDGLTFVVFSGSVPSFLVGLIWWRSYLGTILELKYLECTKLNRLDRASEEAPKQRQAVQKKDE